MRPIGRAPTGTLALPMTLACLSTPMLYAQQPTPRATLIAAAREIIAAARFCALVTVDDSGQPHARGMDPFEPDEDFTIWMGTNRHTRKVREIARDPRVTLYCQNPQGSGYVTIMGTARLVDDPAEKARRWKTEWDQFYPDRDREYLLIAVTPRRMEVIDYGRGIAGDPETWTVPAVEF